MWGRCLLLPALKNRPYRAALTVLRPFLTVLRPFSAFRHSPAIDRLAIRGYSYETECDSGACGGSGGSIFYGACGGPCSTENVTAFPQSVGMGATWNVTLERAKGEVIGRELRSIAAANRANYDAVYGLSCFSPMINIIRDPFWGRNSEGYSECPHLTGEMAHSVVTGMQGDDPRYVQVVAGCKHFVPCEAAHLPTTPLCSMRWSNPHHPHPPALAAPFPLPLPALPRRSLTPGCACCGWARLADDGPATSTASDYDLFSTYLPGFKRCMEAKGPAWQGALNVMCSYTQDGRRDPRSAPFARSAHCLRAWAHTVRVPGNVRACRISEPAASGKERANGADVMVNGGVGHMHRLPGAQAPTRARTVGSLTRFSRSGTTSPGLSSRILARSTSTSQTPSRLAWTCTSDPGRV